MTGPRVAGAACPMHVTAIEPLLAMGRPPPGVHIVRPMHETANELASNSRILWFSGRYVHPMHPASPGTTP